MTYFLLITAFTVSIDSLVCGFSLCFTGNKKILIVSGIAATVFVMCCITNYLAYFLQEVLTERAACLGGIILIGVGIYNLVKKDEKNTVTDGSAFRQSIITGFAVGLDGAAANLSLSLMGVNAFYVPLTIALMHALMISAGIIIAENPLAKKADGFGIVPPCVLIMLGVYKLTALLF